MVFHSLVVRIAIVALYFCGSLDVMAAGDARCDSCDQTKHFVTNVSDAASDNCDTASPDQLIGANDDVIRCGPQSDKCRSINVAQAAAPFIPPDIPPPIFRV